MDTRICFGLSIDFARDNYKLRYTYVHPVISCADGRLWLPSIQGRRSILPQAQNEGLQYNSWLVACRQANIEFEGEE